MKLVKWQLGSGGARQRMQIGGDEAVVADFAAPGLLDRIRGVMLQAEIERMPVGLMRPAPWNGMLWRAVTQGRDLATADNPRVGPVNRRERGNFDIGWGGRRLHLKPDDRHGHSYVLLQHGEAAGGLQMRTFERGADWYADLEVPHDLPLAVVAFIGWLTREGRTDLARLHGRR